MDTEPVRRETRIRPADGSFPAYSWFCGVAGRVDSGVSALPDRDNVITDTSGEPWLAGSWRPEQFRMVDAGSTRVVFLGSPCFELPDARRAVERAIDAGRFDGLPLLPGSFHVAVSTPARRLVFGDIAGVRRLFRARRGPVTLFSGHALVLRNLVGAAVEDAWLSVWLACPGNRYLIDSTSPFRGIDLVRPGWGLTIDADGTSSTHRYWSIPDDDADIADTAPVLATGLRAAVSGRLEGASPASSDLSGGLDSTSLAFLAASSIADASGLLTITQPATAANNDDSVWAAKAAELLPGQSRHITIDGDGWPLPFERTGAWPLLDEPARPYTLLAQLRAIAGVLGDHGSQVHFCGHGGDQALLAPIAFLGKTLRTHPVVAVRQLPAHWALHRGLSLRDFARVLRPPAYREWLAGTARGIAGEPSPPTSWGTSPRVAPWMSPSAVDLACGVLSVARDRLEPASPWPGQHAALDRVWDIGSVQRLNGDLNQWLGVRLEFPFLDGHVLDTSMRTRADQRTEPTRAKPLLIDAMEGVVPAELLDRKTKASYQSDFHVGWRAHRRELAALVEESRLADRGLVDADLLRAATRPSLFTNALQMSSFNDTLVCEMWLQALDASPPWRGGTP